MPSTQAPSNQNRYLHYLCILCVIGKLSVLFFGIYPTEPYKLFSYYIYFPFPHPPPSILYTLGHRNLVLVILYVGKTCEKLRNLEKIWLSSVENWALSRLSDSMGVCVSCLCFTLL